MEFIINNKTLKDAIGRISALVEKNLLFLLYRELSLKLILMD